MATGQKISELTAASTASSSDVLAGVQSGVTKRFPLSVLLTWIQSQITAAGIGAVPTTRTVNSKALSADVSLNASDVGARASDWMPTAAQVGAAVPPDIGSISLSASWNGAGPYSQTVTVSGATVTANSKVDLQLTAVQLSTLISGGTTSLVVENNNGTLTVYATGTAPASAMMVQCTVTEVMT